MWFYTILQLIWVICTSRKSFVIDSRRCFVFSILVWYINCVYCCWFYAFVKICKCISPCSICEFSFLYYFCLVHIYLRSIVTEIVVGCDKSVSTIPISRFHDSTYKCPFISTYCHMTYCLVISSI